MVEALNDLLGKYGKRPNVRNPLRRLARAGGRRLFRPQDHLTKSRRLELKCLLSVCQTAGVTLWIRIS